MVYYILLYLSFNVRQVLIPKIYLHCILLYIFSYYEPAFTGPSDCAV